MRQQWNKCFCPSQHPVTISPYHLDTLLCPWDRQASSYCFIFFPSLPLQAPEPLYIKSRESLAAATRCSSSLSICCPFPAPAARRRDGKPSSPARQQPSAKPLASAGKPGSKHRWRAKPPPSPQPPYSHPAPGKVQSPEMLPPPRWRLSPRDVPGREGIERSPGCQKKALASKKMM